MPSTTRSEQQPPATRRDDDRHWWTGLPGGFNALVQGASRGIGLALVREILTAPSCGRVFATCRNPGRAASLQRLAADDDRLSVLRLDVQDEDSIAKAARDVAGHTPQLNLLINSAGVLHDGDMRPEKNLDQLQTGNLLQAFTINAVGPAMVLRYFQSLLTHGERTLVSNISARVGSIGDNSLGGWYGYRASKAAQNQLTRTAALELGRRSRQLVCVALHPGTVATDLSAPFRQNLPADRVFCPDRAARQLLAVLGQLSPADSGGFFAWDGAPIPW